MLLLLEPLQRVWQGIARNGDDVSASIMAGIIRAIKVACSDAIIRAQRPNRFKKACASCTLSITERVLQV